MLATTYMGDPSSTASGGTFSSSLLQIVSDQFSQSYAVRSINPLVTPKDNQGKLQNYA
jgi:hypothetical protein